MDQFRCTDLLSVTIGHLLGVCISVTADSVTCGRIDSGVGERRSRRRTTGELVVEDAYRVSHRQEGVAPPWNRY